jgi:hypothetical protein
LKTVVVVVVVVVVCAVVVVGYKNSLLLHALASEKTAYPQLSV